MEKSLHEAANKAEFESTVVWQLGAIITLLQYLAGVQVGVEEGTDDEEDSED